MLWVYSYSHQTHFYLTLIPKCFNYSKLRLFVVGIFLVYCRIIAKITDASHPGFTYWPLLSLQTPKSSPDLVIYPLLLMKVYSIFFLCVCLCHYLTCFYLVPTCHSCHRDPTRCYFIFLFLDLRALLKALTKWFPTLFRFHESFVDIRMILFIPGLWCASTTVWPMFLDILSLHSCLSLINLGYIVSMLKIVVRVLFIQSVPVWPFIYNLFYSHASLLFTVCICGVCFELVS